MTFQEFADLRGLTVCVNQSGHVPIIVISRPDKQMTICIPAYSWPLWGSRKPDIEDALHHLHILQRTGTMDDLLVSMFGYTGFLEFKECSLA